jgi:hypothetical protein
MFSISTKPLTPVSLCLPGLFEGPFSNMLDIIRCDKKHQSFIEVIFLLAMDHFEIDLTIKGGKVAAKKLQYAEHCLLSP